MNLIRYLLLYISLFGINSCEIFQTNQEYKYIAIKKSLLENGILREDNITELKFAAEVSLAKCWLNAFSEDSCFVNALRNDLSYRYDNFISLYNLRYWNKYYHFSNSLVEITDEDEELAIHIYPVTKSVCIGYIREIRKTLTSRGYKFYAVLEGDSVRCLDVHRMSGSYYTKPKEKEYVN